MGKRRTEPLPEKPCIICGVTMTPRRGTWNQYEKASMFNKRTTCSMRCRCLAATKRYRDSIQLKPCKHCGKTMELRQWGQKTVKLETRKRYEGRNFCDAVCSNAWQATRNVVRSPEYIRQLARKSIDVSKCAHCGTTENIHAHHRDGRAYTLHDNRPENLLALCHRCHFDEHKRMDDTGQHAPISVGLVLRQMYTTRKATGQDGRTHEQTGSVGGLIREAQLANPGVAKLKGGVKTGTKWSEERKAAARGKKWTVERKLAARGRKWSKEQKLAVTGRKWSEERKLAARGKKWSEERKKAAREARNSHLPE